MNKNYYPNRNLKNKPYYSSSKHAGGTGGKNKGAILELSESMHVANPHHFMNRNVIWNGIGTASEWFQAKSKIKNEISAYGGKIAFVDISREVQEPDNGPWPEDAF